MSEFFLELFSEEIPAGLQKDLREKLLNGFQKFFSDKSIKSKKNFSLSTPNRMIVVFENLDKQITIKSEEVKGPNTNAPGQALEGFMKSKKTRTIAKYSYHSYQAFRIYRNPFILLEYLNECSGSINKNSIHKSLD